MDYVINPWFFYWINVVGSISLASIIFGVTLGITFIICLPCYWWAKYNKYWGCEENDMVTIRKVWKNSCKISSIFVIFVLIAIFTPTEKTLIQMAIAKNITYSNISKAKKEIATDAKAIVDYMFDKVNGTIKEIKK